ncbi:MAG: alanine--glyoxylate aminotransferase family protein, partial [Gemmatimonadetes bacterium]|nr:alanine--glyoxylate aminotransferase family protein [Gemmatimonadota bacterium]
NHLGPTMDRLVEHIKQLAGYAFQTADKHILGVGGPASAAMEMAMGNLLWPGRRALVLQNGWFSGRFAEMAAGVGAEVDVLAVPEGQAICAERVAERLKNQHYDVVTMVQGETSSGVCTTELPAIARLCREHGALAVVDAVCTLSTMPLEKDAWGVDVVITGSQKGLSALPGVALIAFSDAAWEQVQQHPGPKPHWCLDALRAENFWQQHQYHYTAPVSGLLALHEALRLVCEETLERRFARHRHSSLALQAGIEKMGLVLAAPRRIRLNSVVAIQVPAGIDSARVRADMSNRFHVEISGAFGLDIVRIGQMGEQCRAPHLFRVLHALGGALAHEGASMNTSAGMAALEYYLTGYADDLF